MTVAVKERHIDLSSEEVRDALNKGTIVITRAVKPQPERSGDGWLYRGQFFGDDDSMKSHLFHDVYGGDKGFPYGGVYGDGSADRLWVREKHVLDFLPGFPQTPENCAVHYYACHPHPVIRDGWNGHWRPSIVMPRWASRITLELKDVGVERVQDIDRFVWLISLARL